MHDSLDLEFLYDDTNRVKTRQWIALAVGFIVGIVLVTILAFAGIFIGSLYGEEALTLWNYAVVPGFFLYPVALLIWRQYIAIRAAVRRVLQHPPPAMFPEPLHIPGIRNFIRDYFVSSAWVIAYLVLAIILPFHFAINLLLILFIASMIQRLQNWFILRGDIQQGNYHRILQRIHGMQQWWPLNKTGLLVLEASMSAHLNDLEKCKSIFRELALQAYQTGNINLLKVTLNDMAFHMAVTGELEEGLPLMETAIRLDPRQIAFIDSLIFWYLEQKLHPERALELIDYALQFKMNAQHQFLYNARRIYALALDGQKDEASDILWEIVAADQRQPTMPAHIQADVLRYLGLTAQALGNKEHARKFFEQSIESASEGILLNLSRQSLAELTATNG